MAAWFFSRPFRRNNYYYGKLLTSRDFSNEQAYAGDKRRLVNQCVLGTGVVFGLEVSVSAGNLVLQPGLAIDPRGREIIVRDAVSSKAADLKKDWKDGEAYYLCAFFDESKCEETLPVANQEPGDPAQKVHNYVAEGYRLSLEAKKDAPASWRLGEGDAYAAVKATNPSGSAFLAGCAEAFRKNAARAIELDGTDDLPVCLAKLVKQGGTIKVEKDKELDKQFVFSPAFLYDMLVEAFERPTSAGRLADSFDTSSGKALEIPDSPKSSLLKSDTAEAQDAGAGQLEARVAELEKRLELLEIKIDKMGK